jgi:hypothetical protein
LNALVPTQRLWTKINDSIAREKKSFWKPIFRVFYTAADGGVCQFDFRRVVSITLLSLRTRRSD